MLLTSGRVGRVGQALRASSALPAPASSSDFTQGSTPNTFSRASAANRWNASGQREAVPTDVARIDYNPQTLTIRGLLIEEQRTNYFLNSLSPVTQVINLATGIYTLWMEGSGSVTSAAITAVGTGFGTANNPSGLGTFGSPNTFTITTAGTVTFTLSGSVTAVQVENGPFPTSMITSAGAATTRASDQASGPLTVFNAVEGTLYVRAIAYQNVNLGTAAHIDNGTVNNAYALNHRVNNYQEGFVTTVSGTPSSITQAPLPILFKPYQMSGAYKSGDFGFTIDQQVVVTMGTTSLPTGITTVRYGSSGTSQFFNGWIQAFSYYALRLTNTQLRALTATGESYATLQDINSAELGDINDNSLETRA